MSAASALPVLDDAALKLIDEELTTPGVRLVLGSVVDMAGVARYGQDHYGQQDAAGLADRFRFAWSA